MQVRGFWICMHDPEHGKRTQPMDGDSWYQDMLMTNLSVRFCDRWELKDCLRTDGRGGLIWYTDGSKISKGTGDGVYGYGTRRKLSFSPGQYTTVFQAEVHAIMACVVENLDKNYRNRNICILSDSQATIKALHNHQITSKLVWDCHQSLTRLAKHNRVQLIWVMKGIDVNKMADHLAKLGSKQPFMGSEQSETIRNNRIP
jgi:ribonuclease HI